MRPIVYVCLGIAVPAISTAAPPQPKVQICHATASDSNPYVLVSVRESDVQGHLDGTNPGHIGVVGKGPDFLWDPQRHDTGCELLPVPTLWSKCSDFEPVEAVIFDLYGDPTFVSVPCPDYHALVELPEGATHIVSQGPIMGSSWWSYIRGDLESPFYGVNTPTVGTIVELGINGGPFEILCPAEGTYAGYSYNFFGGLTERPTSCVPGEIVGELSPDDYALRGYLKCPANGTISVHWTDGIDPAVDESDFETFSCTAGSRVDITNL